jgi:hypothetical protein
MNDLVYRLRKRAEIRRQISTRKSVQEGQPDRIADLLEEAADAVEHRGWVGLTDEEIRRIACGDVECWSWSEAALFKSIARAVEAALKEKNQ